MERAFFLRRALRAGMRAPAVASNALARATVLEAVAELNEEIAELEQEMAFAERRARGVPLAVLGRRAARVAGPAGEYALESHVPTAGAVGADAQAERAAREE